MLSDTARGLIREIISHPDDDQPRLVHADWLEERGEAERAECIRLQCEQARLQDDGSATQALFDYVHASDRDAAKDVDWDAVDPAVARRIAIDERLKELRKRNERAWKATEARPRFGLTWEGMERGFFSVTRLRSVNALVRSLFVQAPLSRLEIWGDALDPAGARLLAESGILVRLTGLVLHRFPTALFRPLCESPDARHIRTLRCTRPRQPDTFVRALADSSNWSGLRRLDFHNVLTLPRSAEELFGAAHLRRLTHVRLWTSRWAVRTARALAEAGWTALQELELFQSDLDDECASILADAPFGRLRALNVSLRRGGGAGASALLASPTLRNLTVLNLSRGSIRDLDAGLLKKARKSSLQVLNLEGNRLSPADLAGLVTSPACRNLVWLDLDYNQLDDRAMEALAEAPALPKLAVLNLLFNQIGGAGVTALAKWRGLASVQALHLNGSPIGGAGAHALAGSPHLGQLRHLCVGRKTIDAAALRALRRRFGKALQVS